MIHKLGSFLQIKSIYLSCLNFVDDSDKRIQPIIDMIVLNIPELKKEYKKVVVDFHSILDDVQKKQETIFTLLLKKVKNLRIKRK